MDAQTGSTYRKPFSIDQKAIPHYLYVHKLAQSIAQNKRLVELEGKGKCSQPRGKKGAHQEIQQNGEIANFPKIKLQEKEQRKGQSHEYKEVVAKEYRHGDHNQAHPEIPIGISTWLSDLLSLGQKHQGNDLVQPSA